MTERYLAVTPYRSGLGNVIMSYECALAIAHITGRKLILPPTVFLYLINYGNKESQHSLWDIFDRDATDELFEIADYWSVPEFSNKHNQIQTDKSWLENIKLITDDYYRITFPDGDTKFKLSHGRLCFVNNIQQYIDDQDYVKFTSSREILDLDRPEKFLHFENNLFQNYWFITYPGGPQDRNQLKQKINTVTKYRKYYYDLFDNTLMATLSKYNAVHIRRNDFAQQFHKSISSIDSGEKLLGQLVRVFDTNKPLYIATDEKNPDFFDRVRKVYKNIYFLKEVITKKLTLLESAILEQIICSKAEIFYGITTSTFSRRIHVMRGIDGRATTDNTGINDLNYRVSETSNMPWTLRSDKEWVWSRSPYIQWTMESV